jgi:hypothetical protein
LTSGAETTVDAIFNLSLDAANHVDDANSFLSAIGDLITANNDSNAEAVNDQAALTIATDAEAYATASGEHATAAADALAAVQTSKGQVDDFAATATGRHQDATAAHAEVQTDLLEAQGLGEDLAALQAKRAEAGVAYTALTDAASAAGTAYSSALDVHNGALTTSLNLVETERHNTELAYNGANAAFAAAAQY